MTRKKKIQQKTLEVLHDAARFRLLLVETLQRRHFPKLKRSGVVSWLQRRIENDHLQSAMLYGQRTYYAVTEKAVRTLKSRGYHVSRNATRPLGPEAKRTYLAFSLYCNPEKGKLKSLYRPAFDAELFPELSAFQANTNCDPLRRKLFYRDGDVIGYFVVDRGQREFIAKKVRPKLFDLLTPEKYPEFRALVDADQFRLTVVTATPSRADELSEELHAPPPPFPVQIVVYPELLLEQPSLSSPTLF